VKTFLFYDLETTGLSKPFDQVLQFAAIRTDAEWRELERYEYRIRLNPDVIPAPEALLTHRLGIHDIQQGMTEYDAIRHIHALLNTKDTISLGYNTLGFDDEFLRFSFYRNLLPAYTHQYAQRCGRMDLYPMTLMYYLYRDDMLQWPIVDGKISLRLEQLNAANQLADSRAHDAMGDVETTLALAKRLATDTRMWQYLCDSFQKKKDLERMLPLQQGMALCIRGRLGTADAFQCPVLFLGEHRHYRNQSVWLRLDNPLLQDTTAETIANTTRSLSKKPGEPDFLLPMTDRFCRHLTKERRTLAETNDEWLQNNPMIFSAIREHHLNFKWPVFPQTDWEAKLYLNGFYSPEEERFCRQFHAASTPPEKVALTERAPSGILQHLTIRLLARCFPEALTPALTEEYNRFVDDSRSEDETRIPVDHQGKQRLTRQKALADTEALRATEGRSAEDYRLLDDYIGWLQKTRIK